MMTHTIKLHNAADQEIGKLRQSWLYLPEMITIEGRLFQRYGQIGRYRYVEVANHYVVGTHKDDAEVIWKG